MNDNVPNPPAGWYPDGNGKNRWWDGTTWGRFQEELPLSGAAAADPPPQTSGGVSGVDVAAIILAILLAPVGLVLGIVAFSKARKAGRPRGLALTAIIVGALLSLAGLVVSAIITVVATQVVGGAEKSEFCASSGLQSLYSEWDEISTSVDALYGGSGGELSQYDRELLSVSLDSMSGTAMKMGWEEYGAVKEAASELNDALLTISGDLSETDLAPEDRPNVEMLLTHLDDARADVCNG